MDVNITIEKASSLEYYPSVAKASLLEDLEEVYKEKRNEGTCERTYLSYCPTP